MRKEILITNYKPATLKTIRQVLKITDDDLIKYENIDLEKLNEIEKMGSPIPVDIFYLFYLYNVYKEFRGNNKGYVLPSFTSDILFPHPKGLQYQEDIVKSENFKGFPVERNRKGGIKWVATIKTKNGKRRVIYWEKRRVEFKIKGEHVLNPGLRQKVAFKNHPTKLHTCLFTGKVLSIEYRYISPSRINMLNEEYDETLYYYDKDVIEIATYLYGIDKCEKFKKAMKIEEDYTSIEDIIDTLNSYITNEKRNYVSPGVMSDSPDRIDGYHSYNADIRDIIDTGRSKENLLKYTQDRRVYEMWSGGNWKKADRLYAVFVKNGVSPDHIGPISLGFTHRAKFKPLTQSENSAKGNRMSFDDVKELISDEEKGEEVITCHSKYIWDKLKNNVKNDDDAKLLSTLMRQNLHHILIIFSIIQKNGYKDFLKQFLNPQHSYFSYTFEGFNPIDGSYTKCEEISLNGRNQKNNAIRYERIAFESLVKYQDKENRNAKICSDNEIYNMLNELLSILKKNNEKQARSLLENIFEQLATSAKL